MQGDDRLLTVEEARKITVPIVYGLIDERGLFYVGQTKVPHQRFVQHLRGETPNRKLRGRVKAAGDALRIQILRYAPEDLREAERQEINAGSGLVNLFGTPGYEHFTAREQKPWHGPRGIGSPSQWARRMTGDRNNPKLRALLDRMSDAERCGYELALLAEFHPIVQRRFAKWLRETRDRMLECLNGGDEGRATAS